MSENTDCHFHGNKRFVGTHLMRLACPHCGEHKVVYVCDECTVAVRSYEEGLDRLTLKCSKCHQNVLVRERWKIIGKA